MTAILTPNLEVPGRRSLHKRDPDPDADRFGHLAVCDRPSVVFDELTEELAYALVHRDRNVQVEPGPSDLSTECDRALAGAVGALDDLVVLTSLMVAAGGGALTSDVSSLWKLLAAEVPALGTMSFANLPESGLLLDGTRWSGLPFIEGETLHYKPSAPVPPREGNVPLQSPTAGLPT